MRIQRLTDADLDERYEKTPEGRNKIEQLEGALELVARQKKNIFKIPVDGDYLSFMFTGDWHLGSLYERLDVIRAIYETARKRKIKIIIHSGDIFDGHNIYKGQEFELHQHGWDRQKKWGLKNIPRIPGITTYFITGNHDESMEKLAGVNVGEEWAAARPDWKYIGKSYGTVEFQAPQGKFVVGLIHPDGGTAYAISYRAQKIVEQMEGGTKPHLLGIGHFHKADLLPSYRNIAAIQTGTAQAQTPFMMRKASAAHVGFWEVSAHMQKLAGKFRTEFHAFY